PSSRINPLWDNLPPRFNQAALLCIPDIYAASEAPIAGVTSEALAAAIREAGHKNVHYIRSMQDSIGFLLRNAKPGDAILTVGAGSVGRASNELMILLGTDQLTYRIPERHAP